MEKKVKFRLISILCKMTYTFAFLSFIIMLIGIFCQNNIDGFKDSIYDFIIGISFLACMFLSFTANIFLSIFNR